MTVGVAIIGFLAILGLISVVRRLGTTFELTRRDLRRSLQSSLSFARRAVHYSSQILGRFVGILVSTITLGHYCVRKVTPIAVSTARKTFGAMRRPQTNQPQIVKPIVATQQTTTGSKPIGSTKAGPFFPRLRTAIWSPIGPICVLVVFVAMSGAYREDLERLLINSRKPEFWAGTAAPKVAVESGVTIQPSNAIPLREADPEGLRPKWITEGNVTQGDVKRIVLSSKLWSSVEEARKALSDEATRIIRDDFEQRHHGPFVPVTNRILNEKRLIDVAVKEQFLEQVDHDFGKYSAPMHRLWWQLEISPVVRTELFSDWKAATVQNKVIFTGGVLAMITLLAKLISTFSLPARPQEPAVNKMATNFPSPSLN